MNPINIPRGPGKLTFLGIIPATGDITITFDGEAKPVATLAQGPDSAHYQGGGSFLISVPPVASLTTVAPLYALLAALGLGDAIAPRRFTVTAVNVSTEAITTSVAHGLTTADAVRVARGDGPWADLSAGSLSDSTSYYAKVLTGTTLSLHPTGADATAGTNTINFTAWTEATHSPFYICRDLPAVVHFADGTRYTFYNVGIESLPTIVGGADAIHLDGPIVLRAFVATGSDTAATSAYYLRDRATYAAPAVIGTTRLTTPFTAAWSTLTAIKSETPWKITFAPQLADIPCSTVGIASKLLSGMKVTVTGKPQTIKTTDLETEVSLQGAGNGVGSNMPGSTMTLTSSGGATAASIVINSMILSKATIKASIAEQRIGELEWMLTNPTSGGWFTLTA